MEKLLWAVVTILGLLAWVWFYLGRSHSPGWWGRWFWRTTDMRFHSGWRTSSQGSAPTSESSSSSSTRPAAPTATAASATAETVKAVSKGSRDFIERAKRQMEMAIEQQMENHYGGECPWFDPQTHQCLAEPEERAEIADALSRAGWPDLRGTEVMP